MKKVFVEPKMRKIQLNLSENIADSGSDYRGLHFNAYYEICTIQNTNYTLNSTAPIYELLGCMSDYVRSSNNGTVMPLDAYRSYRGR